MRLMILDDDAESRDRLAMLIQYWMTKENEEDLFRVREYGDVDEFLDAFREHPADIVFLDILLERERSGIDVAKLVRLMSETCVIFFTTGSSEYAVDGFAVYALPYCVKPIRPEDIDECMRRARDVLHWKERSIELRIAAQTIPVALRDITYIESELHAILVHRSKGRAPLRTRMTMTEAAELFSDPRFLRVSRSHLVNMDAIADTRGEAFILTDGTSIPVRRQGRAELRAAVEAYRLRNVRK